MQISINLYKTNTDNNNKTNRTCEYGLVAIRCLDIVANVTGRVARREQASHRQTAHRYDIVMADFRCERINAIIATVYFQRKSSCGGFGYHFAIATGMIPMMMGGQHGFQIDRMLLHSGQHTVRINWIHNCRIVCLIVDNLANWTMPPMKIHKQNAEYFPNCDVQTNILGRIRSALTKYM